MSEFQRGGKEQYRSVEEVLEDVLGKLPEESKADPLRRKKDIGTGIEVWLRQNREKIRSIVESAFVGDKDNENKKKEWLLEALFSYRNFQQLKFSSGQINCTGLDLLKFLGIPGREGSGEFREFVNNIFPEQAGTLEIMDADHGNDMPYKEKRKELFKNPDSVKSTKNDIRKLIEILGEDPESEEAKHRLASLLGQDSSENKQEVGLVFPRMWLSLKPTEEAVVKEHVFNEKTFKEISVLPEFNFSLERARQIYFSGIRKLIRYFQKDNTLDRVISADPVSEGYELKRLERWEAFKVSLLDKALDLLRKTHPKIMEEIEANLVLKNFIYNHFKQDIFTLIFDPPINMKIHVATRWLKGPLKTGRPSIVEEQINTFIPFAVDKIVAAVNSYNKRKSIK